jgi:predicted CoA-substrate-specific enzyme activase
VISLGEKGEVVDFVMNDRCAAGTGRFLETMAAVLGVGLEEMGELSLKSKAPFQISSICTVFAESEVISLIAQGRSKEDIVAGIHASIAERIHGMITRVKAREMISFIGGGAKNIGVKKAVEDKLQMKVWVPQEPQFVIALGAALIARESL